MGLIKRIRIEDKGEITIKQSPIEVYAESKPVFPLEPQEESFIQDREEIPEHIELSDAERRAHEILQSAKANAESIRKDAFEKGIDEGRHKVENTIKEALSTLNEAVKERKKIIKDAESEILRLAIKSAEQIIRSEVSLHRDVCLNIVSDAINRVSDREQVIVRVNREDAEYIKRYKEKLSGIVDGIKSFSILEDSQIEPGGCIIETNLGYVDARISTKLHAIEDALKKAAEEGENH